MGVFKIFFIGVFIPLAFFGKASCNCSQDVHCKTKETELFIKDSLVYHINKYDIDISNNAGEETCVNLRKPNFDTHYKYSFKLIIKNLLDLYGKVPTKVSRKLYELFPNPEFVTGENLKKNKYNYDNDTYGNNNYIEKTNNGNANFNHFEDWESESFLENGQYDTEEKKLNDDYYDSNEMENENEDEASFLELQDEYEFDAEDEDLLNNSDDMSNQYESGSFLELDNHRNFVEENENGEESEYLKFDEDEEFSDTNDGESFLELEEDYEDEKDDYSNDSINESDINNDITKSDNKTKNYSFLDIQSNAYEEDIGNDDNINDNDSEEENEYLSFLQMGEIEKKNKFGRNNFAYDQDSLYELDDEGGSFLQTDDDVHEDLETDDDYFLNEKEHSFLERDELTDDLYTDDDDFSSNSNTDYFKHGKTNEHSLTNSVLENGYHADFAKRGQAYEDDPHLNRGPHFDNVYLNEMQHTDDMLSFLQKDAHFINDLIDQEDLDEDDRQWDHFHNEDQLLGNVEETAFIESVKNSRINKAQNKQYTLGKKNSTHPQGPSMPGTSTLKDLTNDADLSLEDSEEVDDIEQAEDTIEIDDTPKINPEDVLDDTEISDKYNNAEATKNENGNFTTTRNNADDIARNNKTTTANKNDNILTAKSEMLKDSAGRKPNMELDNNTFDSELLDQGANEDTLLKDNEDTFTQNEMKTNRNKQRVINPHNYHTDKFDLTNAKDEHEELAESEVNNMEGNILDENLDDNPEELADTMDQMEYANYIVQENLIPHNKKKEQKKQDKEESEITTASTESKASASTAPLFKYFILFLFACFYLTH